jgi:hydroxypyruvate isomerase
MKRIRQSFCIPCFLDDGATLSDLCRTAAKIGYEGAEIWHRGGDFGDLVKTVRDSGLVLASMVGHASLVDGMNNRANHDGIEAELRESIRIARQNGVPNIICFTGNRLPPPSTRQQEIDACIDLLRRVASEAESSGISVNLELFNSRYDHPDYAADSSAFGLAVCRGVDSPAVNLLYDIYHMQIMEGDVIRTLTGNIDQIAHIHTAGVPGRHEIDDTQELNYRAICSALLDAGYAGFVAHELWPTHHTRPEALEQSFAICDVSRE